MDQVGLDKTRWDQVLWCHVDIEHQALAGRGDWMRSRAALFWDTLDRDPVTGWKTRVDICALFNSTVFGQGVPVLWWLIRQDGCCYWERQLGGFLFGTEKQPVCLKIFPGRRVGLKRYFPAISIFVRLVLPRQKYLRRFPIFWCMKLIVQGWCIESSATLALSFPST